MIRLRFGPIRQSSHVIRQSPHDRGSRARGSAPRGAVIAVLLTLGAIGPALAAPPPGANPNSPAAHWYRGLKQPVTGYTCCSIADCRPVDERIDGSGHYEVRLRATIEQPNAPAQWWQVPDRAVLHGHDNPIGEAVACYDSRLDGSGNVVGINFFCFVPDAGT